MRNVVVFPIAGRLRIICSPTRCIPWRRVAIALYIGVNVGLLLWAPERPGPHNADWQVFLSLRDVAPYEITVPGPFRYSPVAAWLFAAVTYLGYWPWLALHVGALWLLRFSPLLLILVLASWGFWLDAMMGNAFALVFVAGLLALRGSRGWALVYIALLCLMPRPVQIPVALWLLWKMPTVRLPALGVVAVHGILTVLSGDGLEWGEVLLSTASGSMGYNLSPSAIVSSVWLVVGIPLAAWLTWRGQVGWASAAISPYLLPMYWLMPLLDLRGAPSVPHRRQVDDRLRHQRVIMRSRTMAGSTMKALRPN